MLLSYSISTDYFPAGFDLIDDLPPENDRDVARDEFVQLHGWKPTCNELDMYLEDPTVKFPEDLCKK